MRFLTASLIFLLSGCASISAMQSPMTAADFKPDNNQFICPNQAEIVANNALTGEAKALDRDLVVFRCTQVIDGHYYDFKRSIHRESASTGLSADILALGLSGVGAIASTEAAQRLAAGSAFVVGAKSAVSKDLYFQETMPAIEASMDSKRNRLLATIISSENGDRTGARYTLINAGSDLAAYQQAGNLYAAITELTQTAAANAQTSQDKLAAVKQGAIIDYISNSIIPTPIVTRMNKLVAAIYHLKDPADRTKLNTIAVALTITPDAAVDFAIERTQVILGIRSAVQSQSDDAARATKIGSIEAVLNPLLGIK